MKLNLRLFSNIICNDFRELIIFDHQLVLCFDVRVNSWQEKLWGKFEPTVQCSDLFWAYHDICTLGWTYFSRLFAYYTFDTLPRPAFCTLPSRMPGKKYHLSETIQTGMKILWSARKIDNHKFITAHAILFYCQNSKFLPKKTTNDTINCSFFFPNLRYLPVMKEFTGTASVRLAELEDLFVDMKARVSSLKSFIDTHSRKLYNMTQTNII